MKKILSLAVGAKKSRHHNPAVVNNKMEGYSIRNLFLGLLITVALITPRTSEARRAIPDNNLSYPILISLEHSTGSGFFLRKDTKLIMVTAAHVLFDENTGDLKSQNAKLLSYSADPTEKTKNIFQLDLSTLLASKKIQRHSSKDVAVAWIANFVEKSDSKINVKMVPGSSVIESAPLGIVMANIDTIKPFKDILVSNTIYVFGYPTSIGIKNIPQIDPLRPLLRFGIIAGLNHTQKTIILDCPSYPGNSGGPVIEVEEDSREINFRVIGVVSQFIPFAETWENKTHKYQNLTISNSGYAVAVSMDSVLELINNYD